VQEAQPENEAARNRSSREPGGLIKASKNAGVELSRNAAGSRAAQAHTTAEPCKFRDI
jgi:hypothetical protein